MAAVEETGEQKVGEVVGYYARIGVAAVRLSEGSLRVGDTIRIRGHTTDFTQPVESMEMDHKPIQEAGRGTEIAIKVQERARQKDEVFRVVP
ncbi:MAG: translation elongation factor-like protein [Candidatus Rokubacteria bacterium]|nr:translation elongation factor-like protein [Candidatus Rokubacteria bacterium]MBI2878898.1 translation elongation factor-like protein [Candidatus Rokubacteria bacterium]